MVNSSVTGAKLADYLKDLAPKIQELKPDVVTIEIGANDVATLQEDTFRSEFSSVLKTLPEGSLVANMPLFNSRPGSTHKASRASEISAEELTQFPNLVPVDLQKVTSDNKTIFGFAPDLFHPNNISYKHWADAFWVSLEPRLK